MKSQVMSLAWKIFKNEKNDVTFSEALNLLGRPLNVKT